MSVPSNGRAFFWVRVTFLVTLLVGLLAYARRDAHRRHARNDWDGSVEVALVVARNGSLDAHAVESLRSRAPQLEAKLASEFRRRRPQAPKPFHFEVYGPVDLAHAPPRPGDNWLGAARFAFDLWCWARGVNRSLGFDPTDADVVVYLIARTPDSALRSSVEGFAEQGGHVAVVEVELDPSMADLALFVVTHEVFHTLGASDKYDAMGHALAPVGLAEPDRSPLYPQRYAEIMARNISLSPADERPPESLEELSVGAWTAREIGWDSP